jgi:hypothetical protein
METTNSQIHAKNKFVILTRTQSYDFCIYNYIQRQRCGGIERFTK